MQNKPVIRATLTITQCERTEAWDAMWRMLLKKPKSKTQEKAQKVSAHPCPIAARKENTVSPA
jgi:hypothetical protein